MNRHTLTVGAFALAVAGCGGGGQSAVPSAAGAPARAATAFSFSVAVPLAASHTTAARRSPRWIPSTTASLHASAAWIVGAARQTPFLDQTLDVATCPVQGAYRICTFVPASVPPQPSGASANGIGFAAAAYSGANGTGALLAGTSATTLNGSQTRCGAALPGFAGETAVCTFALGGDVVSAYVQQSAPLIAGSASSATLAPTFLDGLGNAIGGSECVILRDQLYDVRDDASLFGADPHIGVSVAPTGCSANGVASAGNPLDMQRPDAAFALAYDGTRDDTPKALSLNARDGASGVLGIVNYRPLTVPANPTTFASASAPPQTVTVVPPPSYNGTVSLSVSYCRVARVALQTSADGSASGGTLAPNNDAPTPLVTATAAGTTTSTNGSPVTFIVSPTGVAGVCVLADNVGGTHGVVVSW